VYSVIQVPSATSSSRAALSVVSRASLPFFTAQPAGKSVAGTVNGMLSLSSFLVLSRAVS
jgi:hypothetical protein